MAIKRGKHWLAIVKTALSIPSIVFVLFFSDWNRFVFFCCVIVVLYLFAQWMLNDAEKKLHGY